MRRFGVGKSSKPGREGAGNLARAVGAKVEEDYRITVWMVATERRPRESSHGLDEFVMTLRS
jgi:hypothetical protein